ncbi:MAG: 4-hydroxy-3-methylbut-2-enyl diphosphate reductase [Desulfovibrionaceae bacterium]|nr:4-hydroxy-3-methylbut-2-enyl diphosphate reductase [Desulfovibrionaceae bacterium]MBF0514016.1 4-hydroxy-3-methylbut-2-enyl diphosphate reductase [Desulfovibrionaceae bacterium]
MEVLRAKTAGFCMGVDLALRKLKALLKDNGGVRRIYTFGPIIHNPQVLEAYAAKGVRIAEDPKAIEADSHVVIRAHGVPRATVAALLAKGIQVVDATCPKVKRAQLLIAEQAGEGRTLLLYGEADHPEVRGLLSHGGEGSMVFGDLDELEALPLDPDRAYFLAAQTTQDTAEFVHVRRFLSRKLGKEIPVLDTICGATRERQDEAVELARQVDVMVVAGGFTSGNTRRLAKIARDAGTPCLHVETPDQLDADLLRGKKIGLTAGASTPKDIIDAIYRTLTEL